MMILESRPAMTECRNEERMAELLCNYVDQMGAGTAPSIEDYLAQHRDVADELRPLLLISVGLSKEARLLDEIIYAIGSIGGRDD